MQLFTSYLKFCQNTYGLEYQLDLPVLYSPEVSVCSPVFSTVQKCSVCYNCQFSNLVCFTFIICENNPRQIVYIFHIKRKFTVHLLSHFTFCPDINDFSPESNVASQYSPMFRFVVHFSVPYNSLVVAVTS
jgi:hypothetical protein